MDLTLIKIFVRVAREGSFSRAAELLRLPKSSVSKAVTRLESETRTRLMIRTTRSLRLTAAGLAFYESCLEPLQRLEDAGRSLHGSDSILTGLVRLTAPEDLGSTIIAPVIGQITRANPELRFDLHYTDEIVDLIKDGFDLAIRVGRLRESRLKVKSAGSITLVPVASPDYLSSHPKIRSPKDLDAHSCLSISVRGASSQWQLKSKGETLNLKFHPRIVSNQMTSLLKMAVAGAGIALIPKYLCEKELKNGELTRVLPDWSSAPIPVSVLSSLPSQTSARLKLVSERIHASLLKAL